MSNNEYFIREIDFNNGDLSIYQCSIGDVGYVVWDAAIVLSKFIDSPHFHQTYGGLQDKNVIELGAGTGLVGIVASMNGAKVMVTDLLELVPLMSKNIKENNLKNIEAVPLKWGEETDEKQMLKPDVIFIADCIYYDESLQPLVNTMKQLCSENTQIFMSYEERKTDHKIKLETEFFKLVRQHFDVFEVPRCHHDDLYNSEDIHIYQMKLCAVT